MIDSKITKLSEICGGKVDVDFKELLEKCLENISDNNFNPTAVRKINFSLSLHPDVATKTITMSLESACSLPKKGSRKSIAYFGKGQDGQMGLFIDDPDQSNIYDHMHNNISNMEEVI